MSESYASKVLTYQVVAVVDGSNASRSAPELAEVRCWAVLVCEITVTETGQAVQNRIIPANRDTGLFTLAEAYAELGAVLLEIQAERVAA